MGIFVELNNFEVSKRLIFLKTEIHYGAPKYAEMIDELKEHHEMTCEKIAFVLPVVNSSTVNEWACGGRPNYEAGEAFLELWKTLTGKSDQDIPRIKHWSI
ncbi:hypothetical protein [Acinetobacter sp.]|uniref:hypothetical protein n=1 Tax=Acinetobacter sp. TaxID=472 RepID=UPI0026485D37|nr:hypothetical protein [Acinetobacter sp.]MDN5511435.1 hypothetical protein [Acinetobacter sp.]MDN5524600.1 hypothetical protein [Acinetobacter sp.]